jgi:hypothetical protein
MGNIEDAGGRLQFEVEETRPIDQSAAMIRHSGATDMPQDQSKLVFPGAA